MSEFQLTSSYQPAGDQPRAIEQLTGGIRDGLSQQTLLGVTGSGKTFTMANVIAKEQRPTLVIAHNKTLAAQLCNEFRQFFPENAVHYFVSYYDYYQPEAYMPTSDTYIEKEAQINDEIDRLRHAATQAILSRRDVIIVASVSCIYSLGSPDQYKKEVLQLQVGDVADRAELTRKLVGMQYERTNADVARGKFRVMGDVFEIMPVSGFGGGAEHQEDASMYRIVIEEGRVSDIFMLHPVSRKILDRLENFWLFPAKHYVVESDRIERALQSIEFELQGRLAELEEQGRQLEAQRLQRRTRYDIQMIRNLGYCNGIENYSSHFEGRKPGEPPFTLMDYFPEDFLTIIDESHVTVPQVRGMYAGDQARKKTLVEHGFRLPSAKDNRPLNFDEFAARIGQTVYVSATPGDYEYEHSEQIVEQIVRPTGLTDPTVTICPVTEDGDYPGQVEDLIVRIKDRIDIGERVLVTTLTKKMAEDLTSYLQEDDVKVQYLHSDVETLDRIQVLTDLRKGVYDVVVGVNLLREGLDLPEVSLVGILDADKEGFLRSETSLVQTIGRAARHVNGEVILYADKMTGSLKRAIAETERRRAIQIAHNEKHGITPQSVSKAIGDITELLGKEQEEVNIKEILKIEMQAEPHELREVIAQKTDEMKKAAEMLLYETAATLRDEINALQQELDAKQGGRPEK